MTIDINQHLIYLIEQIRSNLAENETLKETPCAHAWLLTTLSLYGDQLTVLIELYRLFREQSSYILLSFITEHILQHHLAQAEKNLYLQQEFQSIFSNGADETPGFSYTRLHSLLSSSAREMISSLLIRKWYVELEENLLASINSSQVLNQCREKALACLSLSSSSISSILQLILQTETKLNFSRPLNILRCLFVEDLLPLVLETRHKLDIQSHICHKWFISAMEFYLEYHIQTWKIPNQSIVLHGSENRSYRCENPMESLEKLLQSSVNIQENFQWHQFHPCIRSSNRRQRLLELRLLINRSHQSSICCPLECFLFSLSFPIYMQSMINLSKSLEKANYQDYIFLHSTSSIKRLMEKENLLQPMDFIESFHLFMESLKLFQQTQTSPCLKLYGDMIEQIQLHVYLPLAQRLLRIFYFYYTIEKYRQPKEKETKTVVVIDDTPQSPESIQPIASPLVCPDLDHLVEQLTDQSLESRLELCMLYSLSSNKHRTISFCIETLIYLHENYSSNTSSLTWKDCLIISSDYSFLPPSYPLLFNYLLDLLLEHLPPTLILLQFKSSTYPSLLFSTLTPLSLRYIYDQKLLGLFLQYIQTTTKSDRRWLSNTNKRKLDSEQNKLTDEQMIEKIIQHVSHITQWTDEQRRSAIYTYILDERQTLLQSI